MQVSDYLTYPTPDTPYGTGPGQYCYKGSCQGCSDAYCQNQQGATLEPAYPGTTMLGDFSFEFPTPQTVTPTARRDVYDDVPQPSRSTPASMDFPSGDSTIEKYGASEASWTGFYGEYDQELQKKNWFRPTFLDNQSYAGNASPREYARPHTKEVYPEATGMADGAYLDRGIHTRMLSLNRYDTHVAKSQPDGCFLEPATGGRGSVPVCYGDYEQYRDKGEYYERVGAIGGPSSAEAIRSFFLQAKSRLPGTYEEWGGITGGGPGAYGGIDVNTVRGNRVRVLPHYEEWGGVTGGGPGAYGSIDVNKIRGQRERILPNYEDWGGITGGYKGAYGNIDINTIRGNRFPVDQRVNQHVNIGGFNGAHAGEMSEGIDTGNRRENVYPTSITATFGRGAAPEQRSALYQQKLSSLCDHNYDDTPVACEQGNARSPCFANFALRRNESDFADLMVCDSGAPQYWDMNL